MQGMRHAYTNCGKEAPGWVSKWRCFKCDIGILVSINDGAYLVNAYDTNKNDYKNKLILDLGINIGVCFQIKGW